MGLQERGGQLRPGANRGRGRGQGRGREAGAGTEPGGGAGKRAGARGGGAEGGAMSWGRGWSAPQIPLGRPFPDRALDLLRSSEGHTCPQETNIHGTHDSTSSALAATADTPIRCSATPVPPKKSPAPQCLNQSHSLLPIPPHKGCVHTDPSRCRLVDTDLPVVLMKTAWKPSAPWGASSQDPAPLWGL